MIHQWHDGDRSTHSAEPLPLTREQRWDLAGIFGAGLMSSAVIVAAAALSGPRPEPQPMAVRTAPAAPVTITSTEILVPVSTPELQVVPASQPRVARTAPPRRPARVTAKKEQSPKPGKLTRLLAGDGRYSVKPFPTIHDGPR